MILESLRFFNKPKRAPQDPLLISNRDLVRRHCRLTARQCSDPAVLRVAGADLEVVPDDPQIDLTEEAKSVHFDVYAGQ